jgi:hypothetical protein
VLSSPNQPTQAERLEILRLIESGKITAAEGATLLRALSRASEEENPTSGKREEASWLRVVVTDPTTQQQRVKLDIPIGLVNTGLRMGARFAPNLNQEEYQELMRKINEIARTRQPGMLLQTTTSSGEQVSIYVE